MNTRSDALRLAEDMERPMYPHYNPQAAAELRRLQHNNQVLIDALWKACGDDEEAVNSIIASQGELK